MKFPTAIWRIADRSCKRVLWLIDERNSGETTRFDFGTPVAFPVACQQGPACAIVDARAGGATLWTGSQKPHFARDGVAQMLGLPPDKVHGIWVPARAPTAATTPAMPASTLLAHRHRHQPARPRRQPRGPAMGLSQKSLQGFGVPAESDGFANKRLAWETPMVRSQSAGWRPASPCPAPG